MNSKKKGVSLVEVLIATLILMLAIMALTKSYLHAIKSTREVASLTKSKWQHYQGQSGFSLIELMVALSLSVLLSLVLGALLQQYRHHALWQYNYSLLQSKARFSTVYFTHLFNNASFGGCRHNDTTVQIDKRRVKINSWIAPFYETSSKMRSLEQITFDRAVTKNINDEWWISDCEKAEKISIRRAGKSSFILKHTTSKAYPRYALVARRQNMQLFIRSQTLFQKINRHNSQAVLDGVSNIQYKKIDGHTLLINLLFKSKEMTLPWQIKVGAIVDSH